MGRSGRVLSAVLWVLMLCGVAPAQTLLSGTIFDGNGGPLLSGQVYHVTSSLTVPIGKTLTVQAGVLVKFDASERIKVAGRLVVNGTSSSRVIFSSLLDDTAGGDTNGDGSATSPTAGDWWGVLVDTGASVDMGHADVRYAGVAGIASIGVSTFGTGVELSLDDVTVSDGGWDAFGLGFQTSYVSLSVSGCRASNCFGVAMRAPGFASLASLSDNSAQGCVSGNFLSLASPVVPAGTTVVVNPDQLVNGVLVARTVQSLVVPSGAALLLSAGVVVKMGNSTFMDVSGQLQVQGTAQDPVVFTSLEDDSVAGDTDGDGAASPAAPGDWYGVRIRNGASLSMQEAAIHYAGQATWAPVFSSASASSVVLSKVRADQALFDGFQLNAASSVRDCVAWNCGRDGFSMGAGIFDLVRCTAVGNGRYGINRTFASGGDVTGSIAWNNASGNFIGLSSAALSYSCGDPSLAGSNGNINVDPLFVSESTGDLALSAGSPCIDVGDPADQPSGFDLAGFPRLLDGKLDLNRRLDMGAQEFDHVQLALSGNPTPGGNISLEMTGTAGLATFVFIGIASFEVPFKAFGPLAVDISQPSLLVPLAPLPTSLPATLPLDYPVGVPLFTQVLALNGTTAADPGNLSNPLTVLVE